MCVCVCVCVCVYYCEKSNWLIETPFFSCFGVVV